MQASMVSCTLLRILTRVELGRQLPGRSASKIVSTDCSKDDVSHLLRVLGSGRGVKRTFDISVYRAGTW